MHASVSARRPFCRREICSYECSWCLLYLDYGMGGAYASGPLSYAVNGKQYIIGTGADTMYAFALSD